MPELLRREPTRCSSRSGPWRARRSGFQGCGGGSYSSGFTPDPARDCVEEHRFWVDPLNANPIVFDLARPRDRGVQGPFSSRGGGANTRGKKQLGVTAMLVGGIRVVTDPLEDLPASAHAPYQSTAWIPWAFPPDSGPGSRRSRRAMPRRRGPGRGLRGPRRSPRRRRSVA